jgi:hypothetical protein
MQRADKVVEGVSSCLKPGGRFIGEFGGKSNVEKIRVALHQSLRGRATDPSTVDPWYYPSPEEYAKLLSTHGFRVGYIELIPRPTPLPGDIFGWLEVFAQPFVKAVCAEDREAFLTEVRDLVEPDLRQPDGSWLADYVRLRFKAVRER